MKIREFEMKRGILLEAALVVITAALMAIGSYSLRPSALPLVPVETDPLIETDDSVLYQVIPFARAVQMHQEQQALFADARPLIAYENGHIPGALHLDPNSLETWVDELIANTPSDTPIITYCEGVNCSLSKQLAEKLTWLGFEQVYYVVDGWGQWNEQHLPVE